MKTNVKPRAKRRTKLVLSGLGLGAILIAASAFGIARSGTKIPDISTSAKSEIVVPDDIARATNPSGQSLDQLITNLQTRLEAIPGDSVGWATLGIAYVQQAKVTVNSDFYPRADGVLAKSLELNDDDNFLAYAGLSALASARHDFAAAKTYAEQGIAINGYSSILFGALSDAELQLGNYDAAFAAVDKMVSLRPDTTSFARQSYTWELRGDIEQATALMQRAFDVAPNAGDRAFTLFYLGELSFNNGDVAAALDYYNRAQAESPTDPAALAGKAKAEAALGQTETALDHYAELVGRAPEPSYVLEYGELLESIGRTTEARQQYDVFLATQQLFAANGVEADSVATLYDADHGDPAKAMADAETGIATRPFLAMYDAYAWALHVNGRDAEALAASATAMELGVRNPLYLYHSGMIKLSLGDDEGARADLAEALQLNPAFNPLAAPLAAAALASVGGPAA
ncbi:MAG: tetratricopeptide repeat protein [Ilumatobacteraceae bacterium]